MTVRDKFMYNLLKAGFEYEDALFILVEFENNHTIKIEKYLTMDTQYEEAKHGLYIQYLTYHLCDVIKKIHMRITLPSLINPLW